MVSSIFTAVVLSLAVLCDVQYVDVRPSAVFPFCYFFIYQFDSRFVPLVWNRFLNSAKNGLVRSPRCRRSRSLTNRSAFSTRT